MRVRAQATYADHGLNELHCVDAIVSRPHFLMPDKKSALRVKHKGIFILFVLRVFMDVLGHEFVCRTWQLETYRIFKNVNWRL